MIIQIRNWHAGVTPKPCAVVITYCTDPGGEFIEAQAPSGRAFVHNGDKFLLGNLVNRPFAEAVGDLVSLVAKGLVPFRAAYHDARAKGGAK